MAAQMKPRSTQRKIPMTGRNLIPTAATLSAALTPGSSWARTRRRCCSFSEKRAASRLPLDLSDVLIVQLGLATEDLNRRWYELNSGHRISDIQRYAVHRTGWLPRWVGQSRKPGRCSRPNSCCPRRSQKNQRPRSTWPSSSTTCLSRVPRNPCFRSSNGGGKWIERSIEADPIYQTILIAPEKAFWSAVKTGERPVLFDREPPKPRIEAVCVVHIVTH
jgi:hypothetical protein